MISNFLKTRTRIENALSALDKGRLKLPVLSLSEYFSDFSERVVTFNEVPVGPWSTPIADLVMLLKVIACSRPLRAMEVGSYRGYTALGISRHMPPDGRLVTVDRDPQHGEAYLNSKQAGKIERRVGVLSPDLLKNDVLGSYDFVFLDAGHRFEEVKHDTELLLPLINYNGYFLWHDYANWGRFSKENGVPEYLHDLTSSIPVARIEGTGLAIHSPKWVGAHRPSFRSALEEQMGSVHSDPWTTSRVRG